MKTTYNYNHYLRYDEMTEILKGLAEKYPSLMRLRSLNKTEEGRDIWLVELTDTKYGDYSEKPGYCAAGNLHAGETIGSMAVMYFADTLLTNYGTDKRATDLLKNYTIYILPRITPDGTEFWFTDGDVRSLNKQYPIRKELPNGLYMKDIDGDGAVRLMRMKDKNGQWKISEEDPRVMKRKAPDEVDGEFYSVFNEGMIKGDSKVDVYVQPDPYSHDFNRSFPVGWCPDNAQKFAGPYPLYNIETRTVADFVTKTKNLCSFLAYHSDGGIFTYAPYCKSPKDCELEDIERYKAIARICTEETTYPYQNVYDVIGRPKKSGGLLDDFIYFGCGLVGTTLELWDLESRAGARPKWLGPEWHRNGKPIGPDDEFKDMLKIVQWADANIGLDTFMPWTKFNHPQLGEVEIGGFDKKFFLQNPPLELLHQEIEKATRFMYRAVATMPVIELESVDVIAKGDDLYEVTATAVNRRYFPTYVTKEAFDLYDLQPDVMSISGEGVDLYSGKPVEPIGYLPGTSGLKVRIFYARYNCSNINSLKKSVKWVVKAKPGTEIEVCVSSIRAGKASQKVVLS